MRLTEAEEREIVELALHDPSVRFKSSGDINISALQSQRGKCPKVIKRVLKEHSVDIFVPRFVAASDAPVSAAQVPVPAAVPVPHLAAAQVPDPVGTGSPAEPPLELEHQDDDYDDSFSYGGSDLAPDTDAEQDAEQDAPPEAVTSPLQLVPAPPRTASPDWSSTVWAGLNSSLDRQGGGVLAQPNSRLAELMTTCLSQWTLADAMGVVPVQALLDIMTELECIMRLAGSNRLMELDGAVHTDESPRTRSALCDHLNAATQRIWAMEYDLTELEVANRLKAARDERDVDERLIISANSAMLQDSAKSLVVLRTSTKKIAIRVWDDDIDGLYHQKAMLIDKTLKFGSANTSKKGLGRDGVQCRRSVVCPRPHSESARDFEEAFIIREDRLEVHRGDSVYIKYSYKVLTRAEPRDDCVLHPSRLDGPVPIQTRGKSVEEQVAWVLETIVSKVVRR